MRSSGRRPRKGALAHPGRAGHGGHRLDGRPLLGRKIAGKSQRELHDLGLTVENPAPGADS